MNNQELPPAVIEYKGIPYAIIDGPRPNHITQIEGKPKKRKKGKPNQRGIMNRAEILTAMLFVGLFSICIIYAALFR